MNYYTTHLVEATNECLDKFVVDLPLALEAPPQARYNRVVVLKDGRIYYNARVTRSEGTYIAEFATGDRREFSPDEVLETRASE